MTLHKRIAGLVLLASVVPASPAAAQERSVADLYAPGDESHWVFQQNGVTIGHSSSRYEGTELLAGVLAHRFSGAVHIETANAAGPLEQDFTCDVWTDDGGHPLLVRYHNLLGESYSGVDLTFSGTDVRGLLQTGMRTKKRKLDAVEGGYVLANNFVGHMELVLGLRAPAPGESARIDMFSVNMLQPFVLKVEHVEDFGDESGERGALYQDSIGERLRVAADGRLLEVAIPSQKLVLRRDPGPFPSIAITRPHLTVERDDLDLEQVTIEHGEVSLAGTISRPQGATGPLPAVFFVSGSGLQDREGYSGGIDIGTHEILDRLTREGFLVLRVDDRGAGDSTGPLEGMTYEDLIQDAQACVRHLRARDDVDPSRVAVIGHSEGGQTAPILAVREEGLAAIVLMAAPGRDLLTISHEQFVQAKALEGASDEELAAYSDVVVDFLEGVRSGADLDPSSLPPELAAFLPARAWLASHAEQDPLANVRAVTCPILLLHGARDFQVSLERDARPLAAALDDVGHPDHELVVFDELDHLFKRTVGETSTGLDYLKTRPVDAAFLDALVAWLKVRLQ